MSLALDSGRAAYAAHMWSEAVRALTEADLEGDLTADDLERLATAALLIGRPTDGIDIATRAHEGFLVAGDTVGAARSAGWIGMYLTNMGDTERGTGWLARAQSVVAEAAEASSVDGFLLIPGAMRALYGGDPEAAATAFDEALVIGRRFQDRDVIALSQLGQGQVMVMVGQLAAGLALFDEVMVAVTAGEISPVPAGIIYCGVIASCHLVFDLRRAQAWTKALDHWCGAQPDLVMFSGECQAHRAQLYCLHGAWAEALEAAQAAQAWARRGDWNALYGGWYQQGDVQRLRGEIGAAEKSYQLANQTGFEPEPGLALLRLAQGKTGLAQSTIRRAVAGVDSATRMRLLPALVEIELAVGDVAAARAAADELAAITPVGAMPMLEAVVVQCEGAVLLGEEQGTAALTLLRRAWLIWHQLDAPYEAARCRLLAARACRALGDEDSASMEFAAARAVFADLGAMPELALVDALAAAAEDARAGPLSAREIEVVRLASAGITNRAIAGELFISEKTVARHLSNVFAKLGLASRTAVTAYAYEHGLV